MSCKIGAAVFISISLIALIIGLLAGSVQVLDRTEVGFVFNQNTRTIDLTNLYGPGGRHFIGLGNRFVVYPTKVLIYHFGDDDGADEGPISLFTQDGQTVDISCTILTQLITTELSDLYSLWGEDLYDTNFIRIAKTAIRNAAPVFSSNDYFQNRTLIQQTYYDAIRDEFSSYHSNLLHFLLLRIDLPTKLESSISTKIITAQKATTTLAQQVATLIRKETDVIISQGDFDIQQRVTAANINYTNTILQAKAQAQQIVLQTEADALVDAQQIFGFSQNSTKVIINWLWQRYLRELQGVDLWVGWNAVSQIVTP